MGLKKSDHSSREPFDAKTITRPDPTLLTYYLLTSLVAGPFFPIAFLPLYFKYKTLTYRFDDSGVSMSWGILFRREIHLTYRRIQDIHLTRNIVQRWMGLATVNIQTASGSAKPEMSIEGVLEADALRDYLYGRMRGARGEGKEPAFQKTGDEKDGAESTDAALNLLREIRDLLREAASPGGVKG
jgi:putative membrane protein